MAVIKDGNGGTDQLSITPTAKSAKVTAYSSAGVEIVPIADGGAVNLTKIAGATVNTGHGVASGSLRVELPSDGTGVVGLNAGTQLIGKVGIDQTTPGTTNRISANMDQVSGSAITLGQKISASSLPVVLSSDQTGIPTTVADIFPATQNITIQDTGSTVTAGFNSQSLITGSPTAGSTATFTLSGIETVSIQFSGTWTGTLSVEASIDGGTTYTNKFCRLPGTAYAGASSVTANCLLIAGASNYNRIRVRATAVMTGVATITVSESLNAHVVDILNPVRLLDASTNTLMTIKPASTASIATDTSAVVSLSPNSPLPTGSNVIGHVINDASAAVIGHVITDAGSTTAVTGSVTVAQATAASLNATVVGTGTFGTQATLQASSAIAGKFGIDQTTPGTTNGIDIKSVGAIAVVPQQLGSLTGVPVQDAIGLDATGSFTNATQTTSVTASNTDGYSTVVVTINGTYGIATAVFEQSDDGGSNFYPVSMARAGTTPGVIESGYTALTNTSRMWRGTISGSDTFRVRSTAVASGTVNVLISFTAMPTATTATVQALTQQAICNASTETNVAASTSVQTLLAANANNNRLGGSIYNDATTGNLYVGYYSAASLTKFRDKLSPGFRHTIESGYQGIITGLWDGTPSGNARINEDTP